MLFLASLVMLALRFRETWRFAPLLLPMIVMIHFAAPGTLGALKSSFMPSGGLIAEQSFDANEHGSGRIADVGPSLELFKEKPVLGYGYSTLQTSGPDANSRILDNQWLSSLLNIGLVGVFSLIWLFTRFLRGMTRCARRVRTPDGWLPVALCASVAAFAISMFTYDAFTFTQVTFVFFMLLGLGSALVFVEEPILAPQSEAASVASARLRAVRQRRPALSSE
jgi:O-antigen ligase